MSFDVGYWFYSIPHREMNVTVKKCIEAYETDTFQEARSVSVEHILEVLCFFLKSTYWSMTVLSFCRSKEHVLGLALLLY